MKFQIKAIFLPLIGLFSSVIIFNACDMQQGNETPVYYTVTFDSNGGNKVRSQTVEEGKNATKPTDPIKMDFTFNGWYNGNCVFDFSTPITTDIMLEAKWTANSSGTNDGGNTGANSSNQTDTTSTEKSCIVTFNINDGSENPVIQTQTVPANKATMLTMVEILSFSLEGFEFSCWNSSRDGSGTNYADGAEIIISDDITLYAKWNDSLLYTTDIPSVGDIVLANGKTVSISDYCNNKSIYENLNGKVVGVVAFFLEENPQRNFSEDNTYPITGTKQNAYFVGLQRVSRAWCFGMSYCDLVTDTYKSVQGYKKNIEKNLTVCTSSYNQYSTNPTYKFTEESNLSGAESWQNLCEVIDDENAIEINRGVIYGAFYYVNNYATTNEITGVYESGWYLPSIFELLHFSINRRTILNSIEKLDSNWNRLTVNYISSSQSEQKWAADNSYPYVYFLENGSHPVSKRKDTSGVVIAIHRLACE